MKHSELKEKTLKKKNVSALYEALEPEFLMLRELLNARRKAGENQAEIPTLTGTEAPKIIILESTLSNSKHSSSIAILKKVNALE